MNRTGLIAKISIKYVLQTCIWKYFWFFWEFRGILQKYLNFAGPRPREISEALIFGDFNAFFVFVVVVNEGNSECFVQNSREP